MAEALGAGVQHVAGEHRQHRRRPAEQDREQIEADRAEHKLVAADIMEAVDHLLPRVPVAVDSGLRFGSDQEHAQQRNGEQDERDGVGQIGRGGVKIAADRGAEDGADLPGDRRQSDRARQDFARDEIGRERLKRRAGEGARDPEQSGDPEQRGDGRRMSPCQPAEDGGAQRLKRQHRPGDVAPVDPVGGPAGDQGQREQGNELDDADEAELERCVLADPSSGGRCRKPASR